MQSSKCMAAIITPWPYSVFLLAKDARNITTLLRAMKGKNARLNIAVMGSNLLLKLISQLRWWRWKNLWWWRWEFLSNTLISHFTSYFILWQWRGGEGGGGDIVSTSLTSTGEGGLGCGWYSIRTQPSGTKSPPSTSSAPK